MLLAAPELITQVAKSDSSADLSAFIQIPTAATSLGFSTTRIPIVRHHIGIDLHRGKIAITVNDLCYAKWPLSAPEVFDLTSPSFFGYGNMLCIIQLLDCCPHNVSVRSEHKSLFEHVVCARWLDVVVNDPLNIQPWDNSNSSLDP